METKLLTTDEVAEILHCSKRYVCKLLSEKELPGVKIGRKYLVPADALTEWIHKNCEV